MLLLQLFAVVRAELYGSAQSPSVSYIDLDICGHVSARLCGTIQCRADICVADMHSTVHYLNEP